MKFYLAGPFFNEEQRGVMEKIERFCNETNIELYSPRLESYCPPDADDAKRTATFSANVNNLDPEICDFVLARIDNFDPGTMWEIGYAYALDQKVFAFTTVPDRGLNLMLAQSCSGFLQGLPKVFEFLKEAKNGNYERALKWNKPII